MYCTSYTLYLHLEVRGLHLFTRDLPPIVMGKLLQNISEKLTPLKNGLILCTVLILFICLHTLQVCWTVKYIHTVTLEVARACTIMIPFINFAGSYPNQLIDAELWLLYLSSKLVTHYHITQLSVSGHTCFNCNYKDNCLNVYCQYSYSCTCCAGMYPAMLQSNKSTIIHTKWTKIISFFLLYESYHLKHVIHSS